MILQPAGKQLNRGIRSEIERQKAQTQQAQEKIGARVRVLVESVLNGPEHKVLNNGVAIPIGEIVFVAGGMYADSLIRDGIVESATEEPDPVASPLAVSSGPSINGAEIDGGGTSNSALDALDTLISELSKQSTATVARVPQTAPSDSEADPWTDHSPLFEAGLNEPQAVGLFAAGLRSKRLLRESYARSGISELIKVRGVGAVAAKRALRWAGAELEGE